MINPLTVTCYRGYTHAAFTLLQSSSVAAAVGRYVRDKLVEKEYQPEHMERSPNGKWYKVYGRWVQKYMFARYDQDAQKLYVPIAFCDDVVRVLREEGATVVEKRINDYEPRKIDVKMNPKFHDMEHQIELISKCSDPTPGMKGLAMQTGKGKTYSAIKSWVNLGLAGLVVVKGLADQWIKSIREFTNCSPEDIYKLQEFSSLAMLSQHPEYKPNIFVASLKTLQLFSEGKDNYDVLPWNYTEFLRTYGIGVKIVDECHQCFHATVMMDTRSNVQHNLYCSATFTQASRQARDIFLKVFPAEIQYGISAYDKYVTAIMFSYSGEVLEKRCVKPNRGYNHMKYEKELMISERKFNTHINELIIPVINQYFINRMTNKNQKMLIFCSSIEFIDCVVEKLKKEYGDLVVKSYTGANEIADIQDANIIVSTPGKASTGLDLKGLIAVYNTISNRAETTVEQSFGRLRKIDDTELFYIDRYDRNISAQIRHAEDRRMLLRRMCTKYFEYNGLHDIAVQTGEIGRFV